VDAAPDEPVLMLADALPEIPPPPEEPDVEEVAEAVEPLRPTCLFCGGSLPTGRTVNFCPHCGQSQTQILCPECRSEVEPGWRHCVNCGAAVGEA
jgi:tRNA(Ile2) C34 agmatinyltransferase TiaS